ncbi:MAG: hypothetical protein JKY60_18040, partial [Kordiimonadaceae bacterium]|nr:hypothetical protein [Kordiimonadaceae bacterium]
MTEALNSYIRKETIANVVINVAVTAAIVWFTKMDGGTILVGGEEGFGIDILVTAFLLFFIMSFVVMAIQRARVKSGAMAAFSWDAEHRLHRILDRMPKSVWLSALLFAVYSTKDKLGPLLIWTTSGLMAVLALWIAGSGSGTNVAFGGMFIDDGFSRFA